MLYVRGPMQHLGAPGRVTQVHEPLAPPNRVVPVHAPILAATPKPAAACGHASGPAGKKPASWTKPAEFHLRRTFVRRF